MKGRIHAALVVGAAVGLAALVAGPATAAEDGQTLFRTKTCVACHGKDGSKPIQDYPALAGLDAAYLLEQMKDIASGKRVGSPDATGNPRAKGMKDVMHLVNPEQMKAIADWLAGLPAAQLKVAQPPAADQVAKGKDLYKKYGCQACHGPDGTKPLKGYPKVAGQKRNYIAIQMKDIRDGHRKNGKSGTMVPFAKKTSDADIDALADFLSQVGKGS
jgi:cbb3-type cytochrome c oxidase subunit III